MLAQRLVPVKRLIAKLGLSPWYQEAPLVEDQPSVEKVFRHFVGRIQRPFIALVLRAQLAFQHAVDAHRRNAPVKRLIAKLGLSPWYQEAPLVEDQPSVEKVTLQNRRA
jgi:hypothetical protein